MTVDWKDFYKLPIDQRVSKVKEYAKLTDDEIKLLTKEGNLPLDTASRMVENVVGTINLPFGVATNFVINGKPVLVPFCVEEPSVVAASSNAAKLCLPQGFTASSDPSLMIGQIQLISVPKPEEAAKKILAAKNDLIALANSKDATIVKLGGGAKDLEVRVLDSPRGKLVIVHLIVDCLDAMGANLINTMAEYIAPNLEELSEGKVCLRIVSNLAVKRLARAKTVWKKDVIGEDTVEAVLNAYNFAVADPFRAATHNKGIMNGVDAVIIATGNDWRAQEASAHAYAVYKTGKYQPLTKYYKNDSGDLVGEIELPVCVGTQTVANKINPIAQVSLKILGVTKSTQLAQVIACVGLAQNFAALRALATEGIQRGHMRLHARNIAVMAGAKDAQVEKLVELMVSEKNIRLERAKELLEQLK